MSRLLGIGACQMNIIPGEVKRNLDYFAEQVASMKYFSPWIKLVCAPELCFQGAPHWKDVAESIPGPITEYLQQLAKRYNIYLVPGSMYEKDGDTYYNTIPVINPDGDIIGKYHKMFPWRPHEKTQSGNSTFVFEIPGIGKVGVCICYDLWFPELARDLVRKGAEAIIVPFLTGTQDRRQEHIIAQAAAITNQCYIVSVNAVASGGKGQSLIVGPEGNIFQQTGQLPENMIAQLDLEHVRNIRTYGTCGVSRPLASYFHENHQFGSPPSESVRQDPSLKLFNR